MIFSELYSAYYNAVARIIKNAVSELVTRDEMQRVICEYAFGESMLSIIPAFDDERWQLLKKDSETKKYETQITKEPAMPLTLLQKRWLKSVFMDPRIRLFTDISLTDCDANESSVPYSKYSEALNELLKDANPLYKEEDIIIFDKYSDGDHYTDKNYIKNFRTILYALKRNQVLKIKYISKRNQEKYVVILPKHLEYSEKDDKFRLIGQSKKYEYVINLGTIRRVWYSEHSADGACAGRHCANAYTETQSTWIYEGDFTPAVQTGTSGDENISAEAACTVLREEKEQTEKTVIFELTDERKALERVMLGFAHFKKQAERLDENRYRVSVCYDKNDETEMVIRILSFGPMVKVTAPESFTYLIKERLLRQKEMMY